MPQIIGVNRKIVLNSRPEGKPSLDDFRLETADATTPEAGQMLLRTVYLSLDPYMRGRMSDSASYAVPTAIGAVLGGATVARVESSNLAGFKVGDWVLGMGGWQDYSISDGAEVSKLDANATQHSLSLGVLGMPGFTAYMGLLDIGQPKAGDTVVVAAATGAVGAVVGQIAKLKGCRVVGLAGSARKCRYAVEELGFDACIDHHSEKLSQALFAACPKGIDVYFESVGGAVFDAVLPVLNTGARIPLCGLIANYNDAPLSDAAKSDVPDRLGVVMRTLLTKRIKLQGFIIFADYAARFGEFSSQMSSWLKEGKIKFREDIQTGLELAPQAFIGLLEGQNFGKLLVRVGED